MATSGTSNLGMGPLALPTSLQPVVGNTTPSNTLSFSGDQAGPLNSLGIPNFDPAWYLSQYPDVAAASVNPIAHYMTYGRQEGRKQNAQGDGSNTAGDVAKAQPTASNAVSSAPLDPSNPASMAAWRQTAHDQTAGINRLPGMAPDTSTLSADPSQVMGQFRPSVTAANVNRLLALFGGGGGAATPNLGMGPTVGGTFGIPGMGQGGLN